MTASIFADASMVSTVVRVRDVAASVAWYREKLGLEPIHVGADGPAHPHRRLWDRRFGGSLWQLLANRARVLADNDRNSYVVVVMNGELESARRALIDPSTSGRSAASRTMSSSGSMTLITTGSN